LQRGRLLTLLGEGIDPDRLGSILQMILDFIKAIMAIFGV